MANKKKIYTKTINVDDFGEVNREFQRLSDSLNQFGENVATEVTTEAPAKVTDFMIRYADGVNWNPGGKGEGLYIYVAGSWKKFTLS